METIKEILFKTPPPVIKVMPSVTLSIKIQKVLILVFFYTEKMFIFFFVIARFTSKIPIVPQIKTPNMQITVRIQLSPHVVIALNRQLNAIIIVPYF